MAAVTVPMSALRSGALMPAIGLGTWPMSSAEAEVAVAAAIGAGYRMIDTAYAIAQRHDRTPAQVVLRWHIELGAAPIPKSVHPERMAANLDVFDFALEPAEIAAISGIDRGEHVGTDSDLFGH